MLKLRSGCVHMQLYIFIYLYAFMLHSSHVNTIFFLSLLLTSTPTSWLPLPQATKASLPQGFYCVVAIQCTKSYIQFDPKFHVCLCTCSIASRVSPHLCQMHCLFIIQLSLTSRLINFGAHTFHYIPYFHDLCISFCCLFIVKYNAWWCLSEQLSWILL